MKRSEFIRALLTASLLPAIDIVSNSSLFAVERGIDPRDNWGLTPLGPDVPKLQWKPAPLKRSLKTRFIAKHVEGESLTLVKEGTPNAIFVIPQNADSSAIEAANVLQHVFAQMSGAKLPIVSEEKITDNKSTFAVEGKTYDHLISLGETRLAKDVGITARDLDFDGYRLQTQGKVLFLIGRDKTPFTDKGGRPLPEKGPTITRYLQANGTRNAAYSLLERHFGCRWLWPEEGGGAIYPKQKTVKLSPLDESDQPAMTARGIKNYYPEKGVNASGRRQQQTVLPLLHLGYQEFLKKAQNSGIWFEAMRLGTSVEYNVGHSFTGYWKEFGETHRDWFALQADGTRNMTRWYENVGGRAHLDVTNTELIQHIADDAISKFDADSRLTSVSIAPNDGSYPSFCLCEVCRRQDPPSGDHISFSIVNKEGEASRINYPSLSDRYVTFYSKVAEKVVAKHSDKLLGAYAYSVYSSPPLYAKLHPNVFISYVGLSYFNDAQRERDLQSWDMWSQMADKLLLRPNALSGLYGIPANFARKLGKDIKHAYQTGMIGTDFDSLMHDWAGRSLNYYILAKLLWDPSQDIDALIKDYCDKGFDEASPQIQKYFSELEKLTDEVAHNTSDAARTEDGIDRIAVAESLQIMARSYTLQRLDSLQAILDDAKKQTRDEIVLGRIDFLSQGLRYARVESDAIRAYNTKDKAKIQQALQERGRVLKDIYEHHFYAQNIIYTLYRTTSLWKKYGLDGVGSELKE